MCKLICLAQCLKYRIFVEWWSKLQTCVEIKHSMSTIPHNLYSKIVKWLNSKKPPKIISVIHPLAWLFITLSTWSHKSLPIWKFLIPFSWVFCFFSIRKFILCLCMGNSNIYRKKMYLFRLWGKNEKFYILKSTVSQY